MSYTPRTRLNRSSRNGNTQTFRPNKLLVVGVLVLGCILTINTSSAMFSASSALTYIKQKLLSSQLQDSFKVVASQDSASANALAEGYAKTRQKQITAEAMIIKKERLISYVDDFLGSGGATTNSKCQAVAERNNEVLIPKLTEYSVNADLSSSVNLALTSPFKSDQQVAETLNSFTCTLDLAKQGVCTPTGYSADYYDSDFTFFMNKNNLLGNQAQAVKSGLDNIANVGRDQSATLGCNSDTACTQVLVKDNQRVATNSMVAYSVLNQLYNRMALGGSN